MKTRRFFYYGKFVVLGIAGLILFTFVVMWLWNWLVPELFSGPILSYWQTLGILVLSKILLSGLGPRHKSGRSWHSRDHYWSHRYPGSEWRKKFEEKMNGKVAGEPSQTEGPGNGCC